MNKIQITLPLMLHYEREIVQFKEAQKRLISIGEKYGSSVDVGAFLLFLPGHSRTVDNFRKQIENQRRHHVPIRLVETGVQRNNSLAYVQGVPGYNSQNPSDLKRVLDQVSALRDLDGTAPEKLVVAPHVGILVVDSLSKRDFSRPSFYSLTDFLELRGELYGRAKDRFAELSKLASEKGLLLALENAYSATYENAGFWQREDVGKFGMTYQVFNDFPSLLDISAGNLVFDISHFASMNRIPVLFERNKSTVDTSTLFATLGISSWSEFTEKAGKLEDFILHARAYHFSHADGIGIRIPKNTKEGKLWGDGTGPDAVSPETYSRCLRDALAKSLPIAIEVDYDMPLTYREADTFLEARLRDMQS